MAFYFRPVSGNVSLQKLESFAVNRLRLLLQIHKVSGDRLRMLDLVNSLSTVADSDCLIEGTHKDNISHFILRLLLVADQETADFITRVETQLFQFRFSCLTEEEIYKLLRSTQKHVKLSDCPNPATYNHNNIHHILFSLLAIKESAQSWKNVAHKYMQERTGEWFEVPFQSVLPLVARRQVLLHKGWAQVAYGDLEEVLTSICESVLRLSLKQTQQMREIALQDVRMRRLAAVLRSIYRCEVPISLEWNNLSCLFHDQVDESESLFPLCMSNLHHTLHTVHRLKHNDRIQYSLFLKEAGMPVHQAIRFWRQEYSQPSSLPGHHSWQTDERRYVYNIRHLYGLEGARRNYRGHCCASLQKRQLGPSEQGGCPFVHSDHDHLGNLLTTNQIPQEDHTTILNMKEDDPCMACNMYLRCKIELYMSQEDPDVVNTRNKAKPHVQVGVSCHRLGQQESVPGTENTNVKEVHPVCNSSRHIDHVYIDMNRSHADVLDDTVDKSDSDDDVIFVSIKSRQGAVKRRSLSSRAGGKKQVLWYESGTRGGGEMVRSQGKGDATETRSDCHEAIKEQSKTETKWHVLTGDKMSPIDPRLGYEVKGSQSVEASTDEEHLKQGSETSTFRSALKTERDGEFEISSTAHEHFVSIEEICFGPDTVDSCSKGENSVQNDSAISGTDSDLDVNGDVTNDQVSCYEHSVCPSQIESSRHARQKQRVKNLSDQLQDLQIHKPINFYTAFKEVVDGLKSLKNSNLTSRPQN